MLKKGLFINLFLKLFFIFGLGIVFFGHNSKVWAIVDPLASANNKIGIHILDPNEVEKVADLVNSQGGDWGYVTVPLRDDDKDRIKWQRFMDNCSRLHLIPLIRLATVMTPNGWEIPSLYQSLDFANFLNDLNWPTKNRYIIVYNEPNHAHEWGGTKPNPKEYAYILKYTSQIFKNRNSDFFILPAGLDVAAPTTTSSLAFVDFISQMVLSEPDVFEYIDAWTSHAYPNPAFSASPSAKNKTSIVSYVYELAYLKNFTSKNFLVFLTETGWNDQFLSEKTVAEYYRIAFEDIWQDENLVVITPFLFSATDGPFVGFSLFRTNGENKLAYETIKNLKKNKGQPVLASPLMAKALGAKEENLNNSPKEISSNHTNLSTEKWLNIFKWLNLN